MVNWRNMWSSHMMVFAIAIFLIAGVCRIALSIPGRASSNDFAHFYVSSRLLIEGKPVYRTPLAPLFREYDFVYDERIYGATNPPPLVLCFAAFAVLPPKAAYATWALFQALCLVVMLVVTRNLLGTSLSNRAWWLLIALTLVSDPLYYHFCFSQVQLFLGALIYCALLLARWGRTAEACAIITFAGMLKLFPLVLLPWFLVIDAKGPKEVLCRCIGCMVTAFLLLGLTGVQLWHDFFEFALPVVTENMTNQSMNFSVPAFVGNLGLAFVGFEPTVSQAMLFERIGAALGLCFIAVAYAAAFFASRERESQFSILCIAMLIGGATSWMHYFVLLIFPLSFAAIQLTERPVFFRSCLYLVCLFVIVTMLSPFVAIHENLVLLVAIQYLPLYATLALGFLYLDSNFTCLPSRVAWRCPMHECKPFQ